MLQPHSILILGSRGFIGSHLVTHFLEKGYAVAGCDLIEYSTTKYKYHKLSALSADFDDFISANNFTACINAAGSGSVAYSIEHPYNDFEANATTVAKVLGDLGRRQPLCRFIHISSAAVYGNPVALPVSETQQPAPVSPYGCHKQISEIICKEFNQIFGIPVTVIRPFSVYGKGLYKQLLWDLCSKLAVDGNVSLFGTGAETRDFINIADFCSMAELILQSGNFNCHIYNAGNGYETNIRELADIFLEYFPGAKKITFNGQQKQGDPLNWKADITKVEGLGYRQAIKLKDGVQDYINWFLQQQQA